MHLAVIVAVMMAFCEIVCVDASFVALFRGLVDAEKANCFDDDVDCLPDLNPLEIRDCLV